MAYMEKLREGTLADAIEKFALQSRQQSAGDSEDRWDHMAMAPGHTLRDFLNDSRLTPPPVPSSPLSLRDTGEVYGPQNRPQEQTHGDRKVPGSIPGVCGLVNIGNTCYMNAGLQCIRSIPEITQHYLSVKAECTDEAAKSHKGHLSSRLSTLLCKLWSGVFVAVHPQAFKTTLGVLHPQFSGSRQQDCQEFLAMLLDSLHEDSLHEDCIHIQSTDQRLEEQVSNHIAESGSGDCKPTNEIAEQTKEKASVVTQTFRGMLKNEVVCQKCNHQSIKEEPFFYLSVPLPHAFERQIYVQWIPICHQPGTRQSIRLLVTVLKVVTVAVFKDALIDLIGRPLSHDLIQIAEINDNCIVRILADSLTVKQIDDEKCRLYAYELSPLLPAPSHTNNTSSVDPVRDSEREEKGEGEGEGGTNSVSGRKHGKGSDSETEGLPTKMFKSEEQSGPVRNPSPAPMIISPNEQTTSTVEKEDGDGATNAVHMDPSHDSDHNHGNEASPVINQATTAVVVEWHSCAICLEEMVDSDLVTHTSCGAILCRTCLQSSVDYYQKQDGLLRCPICSVAVKSSEAFTPLAQPSSLSADIVKLLQTTIIFRQLSDDGCVHYTAPPAILRLPESSHGLEYYNAISPLLPTSLAHSDDKWTLNLTDSKGRYCSRCLYGSGCHGCVISRSSSHTLRPGDYITVTMGECGDEEMCEVIENHSSLDMKRDSNLTLEECLEVFSQREELVADNLWFCPSCNDFQPASRVLSVNTLPNTLIIHLKRFVYHGTTGSKVDTPVSFPLVLDSHLVSHDCHMTDSLELVACVCHFGSLNFGHYTSYARHMIHNEWAYYNDETLTAGAPSEKDSGSVYILFYRRKDLPVPSLPSVPKTFDDEAEMSSVTQLLRQHKPPSSDSRPPPLPRRSNSIGDLRSSSSSTSTAKNTETIRTQTNSLLASLGIDPTSATITQTLPEATPIIQAQSIPHSPPPPATPSSLLTPPPSNSSSFTQTTPIMEDYMNYDFSDDIIPNTISNRATDIITLAERAKEC